MSGRERLVRETFAALERGDLGAVEAIFAEDAKWRGPEPQWDCLNRARIIEMIRENRADGRLYGTIEQVVEADGAHTLVAFRRAPREPDGIPVDEDGLRWMVLSFGEDGLVTEMKGFEDRAGALAHAISGDAGC